jgi:hypothetical protein
MSGYCWIGLAFLVVIGLLLSFRRSREPIWRVLVRCGMRAEHVPLIVYALAVATAFAFIPRSATDVRYSAARDLGPNTRLDDSILIAPPITTLDERFRLAGEMQRLRGKYLKTAVRSGQTVRSEEALLWPDLSKVQAVPVELAITDGNPNPFLLNQGTRVEILKVDNSPSQHAVIIAIVKSGDKWLALVDGKQLGGTAPGAVKEVRIEALPNGAP